MKLKRERIFAFVAWLPVVSRFRSPASYASLLIDLSAARYGRRDAWPQWSTIHAGNVK